MWKNILETILFIDQWMNHDNMSQHTSVSSVSQHRSISPLFCFLLIFSRRHQSSPPPGFSQSDSVRTVSIAPSEGECAVLTFWTRQNTFRTPSEMRWQRRVCCWRNSWTKHNNMKSLITQSRSSMRILKASYLTHSSTTVLWPQQYSCQYSASSWYSGSSTLSKTIFFQNSGSNKRGHLPAQNSCFLSVSVSTMWSGSTTVTVMTLMMLELTLTSPVMMRRTGPGPGGDPLVTGGTLVSALTMRVWPVCQVHWPGYMIRRVRHLHHPMILLLPTTWPSSWEPSMKLMSSVNLF